MTMIVLARISDRREPLCGWRKIGMVEIDAGVDDCDANAISIGV